LNYNKFLEEGVVFLLQIPKFVRGNNPVDFSANFSFRSSYSHDMTPPAEDEEKVFHNEGLIFSSIRFHELAKYKRWAASESSSHNSFHCLLKSSSEQPKTTRMKFVS
jgi:hypothetical protein